MKQTALLLCLLFVGTTARATPPEIVRLSGVISELGGGPVENGSYSFLVQIFDQATGGQVVYSQPITGSVASGAYSIVLSPATPGALVTALAGSPRFVEVTVQSGPSGPIGQVLLPRQELASVPYALSSLGIPQGAIILWDSPSGCDGAAVTCPCGFSEATEFRGLLVRGADTLSGNEDIPDQPGTNLTTGQADDLLEVPELPSHYHLGAGTHGTTSYWPSGLEDNGDQEYAGPGGDDHDNYRFKSTPTGGDQPHYHPFRTVLFCRRN